MPGNKPKLLLHICCGPCSTSVIENLKTNYLITGYFYNPNIHLEEEYNLRLETLRNFTWKMHIPLVIEEYDSHNWFSAVTGLEQEPEGGRRCEICFKIRMAKALQYARDHDFAVITTTLTVSPLKNAGLINSIGKELTASAEFAGIHYLEADFKKNDGYKRSIQLSKAYDMYRQKYCGCIFSKSG